MKLLAICFCFFSTLVSYSQEADSIAYSFLNKLNQNQFREAYEMLDSSSRKRITPYTLSSIWRNTLSELGEFKDTIDKKIEIKNESTQVIYGVQFENTKQNILTAINADLKIIGFFIQPYKTKIPYKFPEYYDSSKLQEIKYTVINGKYSLPGILSLPTQAKGKIPLVILGHGSGPNDKDESLGPNKVFKDLAVGLAAQGIACYRFDKRTLVYGAKSVDNPDSLTVWDECMDDLLYMIDSFSADSRFSSINFLGHSLTAYLAPRIAENTKKLNSIIIMAGPARPIENLVLEQFLYLQSIDSNADDWIRPIKEIEESIAYLHSDDFDANTDASLLPLSLPGSYWYDLKNYDAVASAKSLKIPILVLQGEKDYQVLMKDFELWKKALARKKGCKLYSYPNLGHGMFKGGDMPGPSQYDIPDNVEYQVIIDIAKFLKE